MSDYIVLDLETQHLADEVGGWGNLEALQVSVACTWDEDNGYRTWWEGQVGDLLSELARADLVVGYNISVFDYAVLSAYGRVDDLGEKTFDILDQIYQQTQRRVGLSVIAMINLGEAKSLAGGVAAVQLWRDRRLEDLAAYCRRDVELTNRLYELWRGQGILWVSGSDYAVWPGPVVAERKERVESGEAAE